MSRPLGPEDRVRPRRWALAVGVAASAGRLPGTAWSLPVELAFGGIDDGASGPSLRLGARWGRTAVARATFTYVGASIDVCPRAWIAERVRVEPCVFAELGVLAASADGLANAEDRRRPFFAVGGRARGQWFVANRVFVEVAAHLEAALVRDTFAARPSTTLHQVSSVVGGVQSGLGVIFW